MGRLPLRLTSQGARVHWLQQRLQVLGYDPGPIDGCFGHRTHAAILHLQHDWGLRTDGVAGPQLLEFLRQDELPRRFYVLQKGESLIEAARFFDSSVRMLRLMNRLSPRDMGYPGQRVLYRPHFTLGVLKSGDNSSQLRLSLRKAAGVVTALAVPLGVFAPAGLEPCSVCPSLVEFARQHDLPLWAVLTATERGQPAPLAALNVREGELRSLAVEMLRAAKEWARGLWLDVGLWRWGEGRGVGRLVRMLKKIDASYPLMLTIPVIKGRSYSSWWCTDIDYSQLAPVVDWFVLGTHHPLLPTCFSALTNCLHRFARVLPPYKTILGIDLQAQQRDFDGKLLAEMSYQEAIVRAYRAGDRPQWDEKRALLRAAAISEDGDEHSLWLMGRQSLRHRIMYLQRTHLAGVALYPLGSEDIRLWDGLHKFHWSG